MTSPAIAPLSDQQPFVLFLRRIWAMALRHAYLHIGSWPRLIEMLYWPIINMATWGFTSLYFVHKFSDAVVIASTLVASVLLVEVFVRMLTTMLMLYLEEIWSRNLGHLFASPIKFSEYVASIVCVALVRSTIAMIPAIILAKFLFGFSLLSLGLPLIAYIALLVLNGVWYGLLIISLLLRYGLAAEWVAWMGTWLLIPLIAPYYPVSILPHAVQVISHLLPATYVFESVKSLIAGNGFHGDVLWTALALNIVYFILASLVFVGAYQGARKRGGLLQVGE